MKSLKAYYISGLILFILIPNIWAKNSENVLKYNFPVWENATELDGTGLYLELIELVYKMSGYSTVRDPEGDIPWNRGVKNVIDNISDTIGGEYENLIRERGLIHPKAPIIENSIFAVYKKSTFPNKAKLINFNGKTIVEMLGFKLYKAIGLKNINLEEVSDEHAAVKMVLLDRGDVALLEEYSFFKAQKAISQMKSDAVVSEIVARRRLYLMFANTPRGRMLADAWDNGLRALVLQNRLVEYENIFRKYGFDSNIPDFTDFF